MNRRAVRLLIAAAAAILSASCTPGGGSIYWTLENEVKVSDSSLPNDVTFFDVTKIVSTGTYYAAAGKIWTVSDSAAAWDVDATLPGPHPDDLCNALVASPFGTTTLYGSFINSTGSLGLYASTTAPSFAGVAVPEALPVAGAQIALLKVVDDAAEPPRRGDGPSAFRRRRFRLRDRLFRGRRVRYCGDLRHDRGRRGDEKKPICDVVYADGTISAWFATEGTKLYTNASRDSPRFHRSPAMTGMTAGEVLTGLFWDGTTRLYVASRAGAVYHSTDGASWTRIEAPTISGAHPPLTRFVDPFIETRNPSRRFGRIRVSTRCRRVPHRYRSHGSRTPRYPCTAATVTKLLHDDAKIVFSPPRRWAACGGRLVLCQP